MIDQERINKIYQKIYDFDIDVTERIQSMMSLPYSGLNLINKIPDNSKILDVGCGFNIFKNLLSKCLVTGIDPVNNNADIKVPIQEYETSEKYNFILCLGSVHYGDESDIRLIVNKLSTMLNSGGKIFWRCRSDLNEITPESQDLFFCWTHEIHQNFCTEFNFTLTDIRDEPSSSSGTRIYAEWTKN